MCNQDLYSIESMYNFLLLIIQFNVEECKSHFSNLLFSALIDFFFYQK